MNESIRTCLKTAREENCAGHFRECLCEIITAVGLLNEKLPDQSTSEKELTVGDLGKQFTEWIKGQYLSGELPLDFTVCIGDFDILRRH